jgi:hypothetical protein
VRGKRAEEEGEYKRWVEEEGEYSTLEVSVDRHTLVQQRLHHTLRSLWITPFPCMKTSPSAVCAINCIISTSVSSGIWVGALGEPTARDLVYWSMLPRHSSVTKHMYCCSESWRTKLAPKKATMEGCRSSHRICIAGVGG